MIGTESRHPKYAFYTTREYWSELRNRLDKTIRGDNVLLMTMSFDHTDSMITQILKSLHQALARGVRVQIGIDGHSFLTDHGRAGPLWTHGRLRSPMRKVFRDKLSAIEALRTYDTCTVTILNKPNHRFSVPIVGRSHIKIALINDNIFIGGCNMDYSGSIDLMVGLQDSKTAKFLYDIMSGIIQAERTGFAMRGADVLRQVDAQTRVLIDAGVKRQSIIYDQAINLIDSAEKWLTITCQFLPNSKTAEHLVMAKKRGVIVDVIYGHPWHQGMMGGLLQHVSKLRERMRVPADYFGHRLNRSDPMLHAKLIACDKGMMIGSHNYVQAGVTFGTAEIALLVQNEKTALQSLRSLERSLKTSA
ncbi:MAG TPA: phospholipase D-like domain-containing protein [Candidatus Saccharimonadales bacterium]|jgi:hypothetical protein